jgi:hypothetical protein
MQLNLLSCDAQRPDKRAIANFFTEYTYADPSLASELTMILLEGDTVDVEVGDNLSNSAMRALRKLDIDYEIVE